MPTIIKRAYPRTAFEAPVDYAVMQSKQAGVFETSIMHNFSAGGLCYETRQPLDPGAEVCVVMSDYNPEHAGPGAYRSYLTRICWVQPLTDSLNHNYIAGARIIARSHDILVGGEEKTRQHCDLCGALMHECGLNCTGENAHLCALCYKHFKFIPNGKIRQCLERYLVGNVV